MSLITTYSWARPKVWNTGSAAERFRHNRRLILENRKKTKEKTSKQQASIDKQATSLTRLPDDVGCNFNLMKGIIMQTKTIDNPGFGDKQMTKEQFVDRWRTWAKDFLKLADIHEYAKFQERVKALAEKNFDA